jgi:hypothetical protein
MFMAGRFLARLEGTINESNEAKLKSLRLMLLTWPRSTGPCAIQHAPALRMLRETFSELFEASNVYEGNNDVQSPCALREHWDAAMMLKDV